MRCSERLGEIAPAQFQAALNRFDLGEFVSAEPVRGGLFGQNVFVTSTAGQHVLRGCPHWDWQFPKERFFARLLHERTAAPVPWPYRIDPAKDIFGWSYVLMPRMPGVQLSDDAERKKLTPEDRLGIARAMGEMLATLHGCTWPHPGEYDFTSDSVFPFEGGFDRWVIAQVRETLRAALAESDRTTREDAAWVEETIAGAEEALVVPFQPCFIMNDYKEGNATVQRIGGEWRVTGVFDLMESYFGDGEMDLARSVGSYGPERARAFVQAYARRRPFRPGYAERFRFYTMRDLLGLWGYGQGHGWFKPEETFRGFAGWAVDLDVMGECG